MLCGYGDHHWMSALALSGSHIVVIGVLFATRPCNEVYSCLLKIFQLLFGEEHAVILPEDHESKMWKLRLRSAAPNPEHPL